MITPWLTETITRLGSRGIEVEVLAPSYRGMRSGTRDGIPVHRFRYAPKRLETLTHDQTAPDRIRERPYLLSLLPGYMVSGSLAAARLARTGRFDVIHAFWPIPHGLLGLAARLAAGVPLVSTFFGVELTWLRRQFPFLAPIARRIIRGSDAVTVISSHTANEVARLVPDSRPRVVPFGAAVAGGDAAGAGTTGAQPATDRPFRLLFIGRLVERKGVTYLLRAVSRLRDSGLDVRLAVVGDGPERSALMAEAGDLGIAGAVEFAGFVPASDLSGRISACDALVLPAVRDSKGDVEGLGVVLLEAMLHDRPVIASDSGGIGDIVIDGRTGLLTRPGDVDSLASAIRRLRDDPALRATLVQGGRAHAESSFSWDRIVDDLEALYADVSAKARRAGHPPTVV